MWRYAVNQPCSYCWQEANASLRRVFDASAGGAVSVRPTGLAASPARKRYQ